MTTERVPIREADSAEDAHGFVKREDIQESHASTLERWKREANGVDLGERIDAGMAKELAQADPKKIRDTIDELLAEETGQFPTFGFYTVWDAKLGAHIEPRHAINDSVMMRQWKQDLENGHSLVHNVEDYTLVYQGQWDQGSGAQLPDEARIVAPFKELFHEDPGQ